MKKILCLLVLILGLICFSSFNLKAANFNGESSRNIDEAITKNVQGALTVSKQHVETINNGTTDKNSNKYFYNAHTIQWVDFKTDSDYKIVTYSGLNADNWKQLTTRQAAADFEKNHPGWLVVAGVNGDFFDNSGNPPTFQPTNNYMTLGDMFRPEVSSASYRDVIGFKNDGSVIIGKPSISTNMYVRLLDENNKVVSDTPIVKCNSALSETGINLITKDAKNSFDLTGYTVYVCKYEINRLASGGSVFVKGTVENIKNDLGNTKPETGYFYLASKDNSLASFKVGNHLKCEYIYLDEWKDVVNAIGCVHQVLKDGVPQERESTDDFCYITHPRTLVGFRADGSMILMAIDGRGKASDYQIGASLWECGEMLRLLGCVNGYNMDGGGSTTLVTRNDFGTFDVINTPSDGGERADGNHILVIKRDPGFSVKAEAINKELVLNVEINNPESYNNISNIKFTVNGVTKDLAASGVTFSNLNLYEPIEITVNYEDIDNYSGTTRVNKMFKTTCEFDYTPVLPGLKVSEINRNSIKVTRNMELPEAQYFKNIVVTVGDNNYNMGDKESIICDNLIEGTDYDVFFKYTYDDPNLGPREEEQKKVTIQTVGYNKPVMDEFVLKSETDGVLTISYKYTDASRIVKKAIVYVNGNVHSELSLKRGTIKVNVGEEKQLVIKIVLECEYEDSKFTIESEEIKYSVQEENPEPSKPDPIDPTPIDPKPSDETPSENTKKKCGKKSSELLISFITLTSLLFVVIKKKEV